MKTLFLVLCSFAAMGQTYTIPEGSWLTTKISNNPKGAIQGHYDTKDFCYYLYLNPPYEKYENSELQVLRMMLEFDLHIDIYNYSRWVIYNKGKYNFKGCVTLDVKVVHKDGKEEVYTFEQFRKYLWP